MNKEPNIRINGILLSQGQAMTVRVALSNFAMWLSEEGLGERDNEKAMTQGYLNSIDSIHTLMLQPKQPASAQITTTKEGE